MKQNDYRGTVNFRDLEFDNTRSEQNTMYIPSNDLHGKYIQYTYNIHSSGEITKNVFPLFKRTKVVYKLFL